METHRGEVIALILEHKGNSAHVFGSVGRGDDVVGSDLDLVVEFEPGATLLDVSRLEQALEELFDVRVDIVSAGALNGRFGERVRREMVSVG